MIARTDEQLCEEAHTLAFFDEGEALGDAVALSSQEGPSATTAGGRSGVRPHARVSRGACGRLELRPDRARAVAELPVPVLYAQHRLATRDAGVVQPERGLVRTAPGPTAAADEGKAQVERWGAIALLRRPEGELPSARVSHGRNW